MQTLDLQDMLASIDCNNKAYRDIFSNVLLRIPNLNIEEGPWLAGGSVRRLFDGSQYEADFDLFFKNEKQLQEYKEKFIDSEVQIFREETDHSINIQLPMLEGILNKIYNNIHTCSSTVKVQLIKIYHPDVDALLDSFDYTLCQFATDGDCLVVGGTSLRDITSKICLPNKITYPKSSMRRLLKYAKQGYTIDDSTFDAILKAASNGEILERDFSTATGIINNQITIRPTQFPAISGYFNLQPAVLKAFQDSLISASTFSEALRDNFKTPEINMNFVQQQLFDQSQFSSQRDGRELDF